MNMITELASLTIIALLVLSPMPARVLRYGDTIPNYEVMTHENGMADWHRTGTYTSLVLDTSISRSTSSLAASLVMSRSVQISSHGEIRSMSSRPNLDMFHTTCFECSPQANWNTPSYNGTYPPDYCSIPMDKGGHQWVLFQWWFVITQNGSALGYDLFKSETFDHQLYWINTALDQGYGVVWEATTINILTVSDSALMTFMKNLNSQLHEKIIWVNLNEFNGHWNKDHFGWSSWPPPQHEIDMMNQKMQRVREIRDTYGLSKLKLAFGPNHDASGIDWELPIDWFKKGLNAGDYYAMSSYWSGQKPYDWEKDADDFFAYLTYGTQGGDGHGPFGGGPFGGYTGKSGESYNDKPWILHEFGHKEWTDINPAKWITRVYYNVATRRDWLKLIVFWGPMDYAELARIAPIYENS